MRHSLGLAFPLGLYGAFQKQGQLFLTTAIQPESYSHRGLPPSSLTLVFKSDLVKCLSLSCLGWPLIQTPPSWHKLLVQGSMARSLLGMAFPLFFLRLVVKKILEDQISLQASTGWIQYGLSWDFPCVYPQSALCTPGHHGPPITDPSFTNSHVQSLPQGTALDFDHLVPALDPPTMSHLPTSLLSTILHTSLALYLLFGRNL